MSTCPKKFPGYEPCERLDPCLVNAYVELQLDPENPTGVILSSSWGDVPIDLSTIVKAGETVTKLELVPTDNPTAIRYMRENGEYDCITGDELSRIVSLHLLKDVDQTTEPEDGITYVFNEDTNLFEPYGLKTAINNLNVALGRIQTSITNLQNQINALDDRVDVIEEKLTPPANTPSDARVAFGNRNVYGDVTNTNSHAHGIFTHDPTVDMVDDTYDA